MRFNIGHKIFSIAGVLLVLMLLAAIVSTSLISQVRRELDVVTNTQLPASEAVARLSGHILEQSVLLQRMFVFLQERRPDAEALETVRRKHDALTARADAEIDSARKLLAEGRSRDTEAHVLTYDRLRPRLEAVARRYAGYLRQAERLARAFKLGDRASFEGWLPRLDAAQDAVHDEVAAFRRAVEGLVDVSMVNASRNESIALHANVTLTLTAALLGLMFGTLVTRRLVRSVRNLVAGTKAVEDGDLNMSVPRMSSDEVGYLTESFNKMVGEIRLKERIKDTFGKYMDPRIVARLLDSPEVTEPGGERRDMTVMFIDLKGFTSISERLPPDDLVRMINRFFNHMTRAIAAHNGVVDKFMGDAVMAFWGPPFTGPDEHGALACRAALAAVARLRDFRAELAHELGGDARNLDVDLRIGISSGEMIVGTVGSDVSKSYTVVGDPVNLGARLEGANKAYGTHILVAEETRAMAADSGLIFREIDLLRVKGKTQPVRIFELAPRGLDRTERRAFERGLAAYRAGDWDGSETAFNIVLAAVEDPASRAYIERVAHFRANPPSREWDGVWSLETK